LAYGERYQAVLDHGSRLSLPADDLKPVIQAELVGGGATDFGVPSMVADVELTPIVGDELERQLAILNACWSFFDEVADRVSPTLRKGPRGGGRDRDEIVEHVLAADQGYAGRFEFKLPPLTIGDHDGIAQHRALVMDAARTYGPEGIPPSKRWPVRYTIRRMAWHILDHAWEMEDKDLTDEEQS
jgi:hypothetical protein